MNKRTLLTSLLLLIVTHFSYGENSFDTTRIINYGASRMEIGEQFYFNDKGQFRFSLSYGMLDLYAQGKWEQRGDSLLLTTTTEPRDYDIELRKNKDIPKGKIGLLFMYKGYYIAKQQYRLDSTSEFQRLNSAQEVDSGYREIIDFDGKKLHLELFHTVFHAAKDPYVVQEKLKKGYNEITINFNKNIQFLNFTNELFLIKENTIQHPNEPYVPALFADEYDTYSDLEEIFFLKEPTQ